jgi:palmitoyltransferase
MSPLYGYVVGVLVLSFLFGLRIADISVVNYLLSPDNYRAGATIAILVIYFLLFLLMSITYFRLLYIVTFDPGYVPLGYTAPVTRASKHKRSIKEKAGVHRSHVPTGSYAHHLSLDGDAETADGQPPGLELFYTKDVFVAEQDGRPKWCTECRNWKPDRAHHCSDVGRCVIKMDHFCPWVGGVVAEHSFKFFVQFNFYTALYCGFLIIVMAIYVHEQQSTPDGWDSQLAAILGLATFFFLFTGGMATSSSLFAFSNLTTIENLNRNTKVWQLAVHLPDPDNTPAMDANGIAYPRITYPLPLSSEKLSTGTADSDRSAVTPVPDPPPSDPRLPHHSTRDRLATRTFAIIRLEPGQSPWDLGAYRNWTSVMGTNILDWFLPIRRSPCCTHEDGRSMYELGWWFERAMVERKLMRREDCGAERPFRKEKMREERKRERRSSGRVETSVGGMVGGNVAPEPETDSGDREKKKRRRKEGHRSNDSEAIELRPASRV